MNTKNIAYLGINAIGYEQLSCIQRKANVAARAGRSTSHFKRQMAYPMQFYEIDL